MRVGIVVEGVSEYASLGCLYDDLAEITGRQWLKVVKADIQPKAPVGVIVRQASRRVRELAQRGADVVILILDREDRRECCAQLAAAVEQGLKASGADASVVIKDRAFENWLIADMAALESSPGRFEVSKNTKSAVQPNKADGVDALVLLKRSAKGAAYHKVEDSKKILGKAQALRIGSHSRSFRRFLRVGGAPQYGDQSKAPA